MYTWTTRRKVLELALGAADTQKSIPVYLTGKLHHLHVRVPNFTNAVTVTVSVADPDGYVYLSEAGLAKDQNHNIVFSKELLLLGEGNTVQVTLSGAPGGAGGTVVVALYYHGVGN
jgi:hypothetical protein